MKGRSGAGRASGGNRGHSSHRAPAEGTTVAAACRGAPAGGGAGRLPGRPGLAPVLHGRHARPGRVPGRRADRPARLPRLRRAPASPLYDWTGHGRRPVHLSAVRRGDLRGRLGAALDGHALGDDPGQPGRPRPVAVAGVRGARLPGPARGPARRDARGLRAGAGHRTGPADPRPRPGQPAAHAARRGGPAHRRRAGARRPHPLVARVRHRDRGGRKADPADLHPVPAAHPQVPAGRHGRRRVRGHGCGRLCGPAA